MRHHCGAEVYTSRFGLYEVDRYRHHYCGDYCPGPELDTEQIDTCDCGAWYVRINGGQKLDIATREPHTCPTPAPVSPPRMPEPPRPVLNGIPIPRLSNG